jgi:hypothetical protein
VCHAHTFDYIDAHKELNPDSKPFDRYSLSGGGVRLDLCHDYNLFGSEVARVGEPRALHDDSADSFTGGDIISGDFIDESHLLWLKITRVVRPVSVCHAPILLQRDLFLEFVRSSCSGSCSKLVKVFREFIRDLRSKHKFRVVHGVVESLEKTLVLVVGADVLDTQLKGDPIDHLVKLFKSEILFLKTWDFSSNLLHSLSFHSVELILIL